MSKKTKVLFAYPAMNIGGSTTCLLSILNGLDYSKYDVDLLLNSNTGDLLYMVPEQVKLLPPALKYQNKKAEYLHRLLSPKYLYHFIKSKRITKKTGLWIRGTQYLELNDVEFYRDINDEYDVAIAALEGDRCKFVARHIKAPKKIAWIHINYKDAKFDPQYDRSTMKKFDNVVLVSEECKNAFDEFFPELVNKSLVVENILSQKYVQRRANENVDLLVDKGKLNLATVCRITFDSKALDRAVKVFAKLKQENRLKDICWYIIGDGSDMQTLKSMISEAGLDDYIKPLGMKKNPYPYLKNMDMFFLPSRWEGKPMVVTEAFMLGLPALVTEYSSAREQVRDGVDGIIVDNSEEGIHKGLKRIIENPELITELHNNVIKTDYSNVEEIKKVEQLIDG